MPQLKLYQYPKCSNCRKAVRFLDAAGCAYTSVDVSTTPPTAGELRQMLRLRGPVRKLFNTSGALYREMGLSARLAEMSEDEALALLQQHGMLVKRPFLIGDGIGLVGFREADWRASLDHCVPAT